MSIFGTTSTSFGGGGMSTNYNAMKDIEVRFIYIMTYTYKFLYLIEHEGVLHSLT